MAFNSEKSKIPDAIFFDWDGTLVDSYGFLNDAHCHVLCALGFEPFKGDEFKNHFGKPREMLYRQIYKDKFEQAKELFELYVIENSSKISFLDGADILVKTLFDRGIKMGIVSNKKSSFIDREITNFGWTGYFQCIIGAGDAHEDKPSSAPLSLAMQKSGIDRKQHHVWYVGDTETDLKCARAANCPAVFINGHEDTNRLIREYNPVLSFDGCRDLLEFLVAK